MSFNLLWKISGLVFLVCVRSTASTSKNCTIKNLGNLILTPPISGQNEYVEHSTITYSCPKNYFLHGTQTNYCIDGSFVSPHPACKRNCSSTILSGMTLRATCVYNGLSVPCVDPIWPGTRAHISCEMGYKKPDRDLVNELICDEDGDWDYHPFSCEPECGTEYVEPKPFIAGGDITDITRVPWHVAIYEEEQGGQYKHVCGGTIINALLILSAAHCYWDSVTQRPRNIEKFKVVAGKYYRNFTADEPSTTQAFDVAEIHIPEEYKDREQPHQNDIAIIVLNNFIQFRPPIKPICRIFESYEKFNLPAGTKGSVASWGLNKNVLKSIEFSTISNDECKRGLPKQHEDFVLNEAFCGESSDGETVWEGDSGSGFVISRRINGMPVHFLWGILSAKAGDEKSNFIFTNIQYHRSMIESYEARFRPK